MLSVNNFYSQDILVVDPGVGTLNDGIDANGGDKIYQLQAGQWYSLTKPIENVDYHLQIIGEEVEICDPVSNQHGIRNLDGDNDVFITNSFIMNHGICDGQ